MAADPAQAVYDRLVAAGVSGLSASNLFKGPVRPRGAGVPVKAVFVLGTGGPVNEPYLGNTQDWRVKTVQVSVRSSPNQYGDGATFARSILVALHRATLAGWTFCLVREPEPNYLGQDEDGTHRFSLNASLGVAE